MTNDDNHGATGATPHSRRALQLAGGVLALVIAGGTAYWANRPVSAHHAAPAGTSSNKAASQNGAPARSTSPSAPRTATTTAGGVTPPQSSSATTTAGPLPGAPPCDGAPGATSPQARPRSLVLGCADYNAAINNIAWTGWGTSAAFGVGTFVENQCVPNCAQGTFATYPNSRVELDDPSNTSGTPVFQHVTVTPSGNAPPYSNPSPGAWGWSH